MHALDALRNDKDKWWAEVQNCMRYSDNQALKMEMVQYVLSRSFVWKEDHPRDSETRSAILMLAADVRGATEPILGSAPNDRKIVESEEYRISLLAALKSSLESAKSTALRPIRQSIPASMPPISAQLLTPNSTSEVQSLTPTLTQEPRLSTKWSIFLVLVISVLGVLWLLLKRQKVTRS